MSKKYTKEDFIRKARQIHGWKYDYSKVDYVNSNTKVCIICPDHGEFWQRPGDHLHGRGCWKCSNCFKSNNQDFISKARQIHDNIYDYSKVEYNGNKNKVIIICPKHGEFEQRPNDHLNGNGCPLCYGKMKSNTKEFIEKANKVHFNEYNYSKVNYIDAFTKVCITCPKHGDFWQTPSNHIGGKSRCPQCNSEVKSNGEKELGKILKSKNIIFIKDKKFDWLKYKRALRLDFYLPEYNIAIEVQGQQHFKPIKYFGGEKEFEIVKNRDEIKYNLCNEHGVEILYINDKLKGVDKLLLEIEEKRKKGRNLGKKS